MKVAPIVLACKRAVVSKQVERLESEEYQWMDRDYLQSISFHPHSVCL